MLSRIADSLFWLNRYLERSDALVRTAKVHYILMLDKGINQHLSWQTVIDVFAHVNEAELQYLKFDNDKSLHKILLDTGNYNSLKVIVGKARENARGVQDHITKEVWENVNQLYHNVNTIGITNTVTGTNVLPLLESLELGCLLYNGVADTTMPRGLGWSFMNLGKYVERTITTIDTGIVFLANVQYNLTEERDILHWRPLLLALSGYELHLKTYKNDDYNHNVIHQILFNKNFTRSVLYTLKRIEKYYKSITEEMSELETITLTRELGRLMSKVEYADMNELNNEALQQFLLDCRSDIIGFSNSLAKQFFSYY